MSAAYHDVLPGVVALVSHHHGQLYRLVVARSMVRCAQCSFVDFRLISVDMLLLSAPQVRSDGVVGGLSMVLVCLVGRA